MRHKIVNSVLYFLMTILTIVIIFLLYPKFISRNEVIEKVVNNITLNETDTIAPSINEIYDATVYISAKEENGGLSTGSGFIYKIDDKYGYIMTNNHVVESSKEISVISTQGKEYEAVILGKDLYSDLAVLRIDNAVLLKHAKIGNSNNSKIGDTVFTVGSPLGIEYMNSVTKGTISGKDRTISVALSDGNYLMEVIQVDAAINPGNSGGPLCNIKGEVIGINSMKLVEKEVEGMGFAIPIETALLTIEQLELGKKIDRPYIGINFIAVNDTWQLYRNNIFLDNNINKGIVLINVEEDSIAKDAGLKKGDVLIEIDNVEINNTAHFKYLLYKHKIGDEIKIKYYREKKYKEIHLILNKIK